MNPIETAIRRMIDQLDASPTKAQVQAIRDVQARHNLTAEEFVRGVNASIDDPKGFFPRPGEFLARARPPRAYDVSIEASSAFDKIKLNLGTEFGWVNPVTGTHWSADKIRARLGDSAARAFLAVGGDAAFKALRDESVSWLRSAFIAAYSDTEESIRLLGSNQREPRKISGETS